MDVQLVTSLAIFHPWVTVIRYTQSITV